MGYEIVGGSLGLLGAGVSGLLVGGVVTAGSDCEGEDFCGLGAAFVGAGSFLVATVFMVPFGVNLAGDASGGDGSYGMSVVGGALGLTAGILLGATLGAAGDAALLPAILLAAASHVGGAVLGYELSCGAGPPARARSERGPAVVPTLAWTGNADGLVAGVAGTL